MVARLQGFNYEAGREHVVVPYEIGGVPVTSIGEWAFSDTFEGANSVRDRAKNSGRLALLLSIGCTNTRPHWMLPSVHRLAQCFRWLLLTHQLAFLLTSVGNSFLDCSALTVSPSSATSIGDMLSRCISLRLVSFLRQIGIIRFHGCTALTSG